MNAMIFAAGLGTRLRPLTDTMPKALVPVAGEPLLEIILRKISNNGFDNIVVNAHHFAEQIVQFLSGRDEKISLERELPGTGSRRVKTGYKPAPLDNADPRVKISYERELLDTGGSRRVKTGYKPAPLDNADPRAAFPLFGNDEPVLVHNVDILSNADLPRLYDSLGGSDVCLLVSRRETTRYLLFDGGMRLVGWTNTATGEVRSPYANLRVSDCMPLAFSGIHVASQRIRPLMLREPDRFPLIDFYVRRCADLQIKGVTQPSLRLLDVGKTATLAAAESFLQELESC